MNVALIENYYRDVLENLQAGVYFTDTHRRITYWNKGAENITGYSSEEVIGSSCMDNLLVHIDGKGNNLCTGKCPLSESIKDGRTREIRIFLHHKDGHRVPVWVRSDPI